MKGESHKEDIYCLKRWKSSSNKLPEQPDSS